MDCWIIWCIPFCFPSHHHNRWTELWWAMFICDVLFEHLINSGLSPFTSPPEVNETMLRNIDVWCCVIFDHLMHPVWSSLTSPQQVNRSILGNVYFWCVVGSSNASHFVLSHITTIVELNYGEKYGFVMCCWTIWCIPFCLPSHHHNSWTELC